MNQQSKKREFFVQNYVRAMIFLLLFVLAFLLSVWLIPFPYYPAAILAILLVQLAILKIPRWNCAAHQQIFDRIQMRKFGVEYCAGFLGDNWQRPYNEFRLEFTHQNWLAFNLYKIRLKHRVLPNLLLTSTLSQSQAENTLKLLLKNSPLKMLKDGNYEDY